MKIHFFPFFPLMVFHQARKIMFQDLSVSYLLFFQGMMSLNDRRSLCAAARNLLCDRKLEDEPEAIVARNQQ